MSRPGTGLHRRSVFYLQDPPCELITGGTAG